MMYQIIQNFILGLLLLITFQSCHDSSNQPNKRSLPDNATAPSEILIKFKTHFTEDSIRTLVENENLEHVRVLRSIDVHVCRIPAGKSVEGIIDKIKSNPNVEYVEANNEYKIPEK